MIVEHVKDKSGTLSALDIIRNLPYEFYPTGSRFFGEATEQSDYDYYTLSTSQVRKDLKKAGFIEQYDENAYNLHDEEVVVVLHKENVDVQLVQDLARRHLAIQAMSDPYVKSYLYSIDKSVRKYIWRAVNSAISLAEDYYSHE